MEEYKKYKSQFSMLTHLENEKRKLRIEMHDLEKSGKFEEAKEKQEELFEVIDYLREKAE